jgi:hypothetical protein
MVSVQSAAEAADAPLLNGAASSSSALPNRRSPDGRPIILKAVSHVTRNTQNVVAQITPWLGSAADRLHKAVKETATKEGAARIARSTWEGFKADLHVCAHASHDMVVLWLCPGPFKAMDIEDQYLHWSVRWNPIYWSMFVPLVPCIILGKWLHSLWGQGDMMRADETIEESRVRLHWIYCLDGPIAAMVLLDLVDVLIDVPGYEQRKFKDSLLSWCAAMAHTPPTSHADQRPVARDGVDMCARQAHGPPPLQTLPITPSPSHLHTRAFTPVPHTRVHRCMTLVVSSAYILANAYFLDVMRRRSLVGVRLVIVYQTVFAVGLLNMLVAVRLPHPHPSPNPNPNSSVSPWLSRWR